VLIVLFGILAVPAFRRLATITEAERGGGSQNLTQSNQSMQPTAGRRA
jgi:hypothetical protein